ncbi:MAG: hydroxyacid dehydrogenase [Opitutaceae bacterium]|jgi:phosphoglycerate dehydrogenase-like enzyme|nr:hydroxyacid dehydrogenase [Opitutaceae bacterium]
MNAEEMDIFFGGTIPSISGDCEIRHLSNQQPITNQWRQTLREINPSIILASWMTPSLPLEHIDSPECALKYVCYTSGSVKHLVPRTFIEKGGLVTNWGTLVAHAVAEHALLLGLAALRNLGCWRHVIANSSQIRRPAFFLQTLLLRGKRVGIHGYGAVARALVALLKPFDVRVKAYSSGVPSWLMNRDGVAPCDSLEELFASSEVLFECEALRPDTETSVTAGLLALLPENAAFINVGRGRVVDEEALCREAQARRIRVALDVVAQEPLTGQSPLVKLEHPVLSPHVGGPTSDQYRMCGRFVINNIRNYMARDTLCGLVTLEMYDLAT